MLSEVRAEFRRYRKMAEDALADLDDESFFHKPGTVVNPIALVVKHVGGNLRSRWTDFLTTDGESRTASGTQSSNSSRAIPANH